jgi:hypothetical protein
MNASQANADQWPYLSPEAAYQMTVSTHILAGTLAVSIPLFRYSFFPSCPTVAKHLFILDHMLGYLE